MDTRSRIVAHRGLWNAHTSPNSASALIEALRLGFSIETDLRDYGANLVISHDPPTGQAQTLSELLNVVNTIERSDTQVLALNIKSDGLETLLTSAHYPGIRANHFFFDMSVPTYIRFSRLGLPLACRLSEYEQYEQSSLLRQKSDWVWLDSFHSDWYLDSQLVRELLETENRVCLVSPELHGRPKDAAWDWVLEYQSKGTNLYVCTDLPFELEEVLR